MLAKFIKFLIAVALMPLVASQVWTLIGLAYAAIPAGQWHETWFISFAAGFTTWFVAYLLLPRTTWLYVLGHEFTHALAAMLAGGKVSSFKVTSQGGHVMTDRVNWWIALSPYFVPIYAFIWIALWLTVDFYYPLKAWQPILFFGIGLFWSFHVTFTFSMFHLRQTDLSGEGYIFSTVVILFFNLIGMLFLFSLLSHDPVMAGKLFLQRTGQSYTYVGQEIAFAATWLWQELHRHLG